MNITDKIYIAGHRGLVGSAILRSLQSQGFTNLLIRTHLELDLKIQANVENFFNKEKPDYVFLVAAKVGGIMANVESPAEFLYDNLIIQSNVINSSYKNNVKKLLFVASSCIYPQLCPQPMKEEYLLSGVLEPTTEGYGIAKIAGLKLCEMYNRQYHAKYVSIVPCNMYGVGDNFNAKSAHVVPALIRRFHEAKINNCAEVMVWGTGKATREVLFVEDLADACIYFMNKCNGNELYNIGIGKDISIADLALTIKEVVGYEGNIVFDTTKPDGMAQKLMDVSKASKAGWSFKTPLREGLEMTYGWYKLQSGIDA